jgi:hypothetical protein
MSTSASSQLVCNSFDTQYKKIQSFRNQYLNMIRLVLKNKNQLTFEEIMSYNEIESKINDLSYDITNYTTEIKRKSNKKISRVQPLNLEIDTNADSQMSEMLVAFLPYMILYYNHLQTIHLSTIPLD